MAKVQNELAEQLSRINEQLAIRNRRSRRIWKMLFGIIAVLMILNLVYVLVGVVSNNAFREHTYAEQNTNFRRDSDLREQS